jgi:RND family efflux transporter MFP subunit
MKRVWKVLKRVLALALVAGAIAGAVWVVKHKLVLASVKEEKVPMETGTAEVRAIEQLVRSVGEVVSSQATEIKSEISGRVKKLNVKAGDTVKADDVLLELDAEEEKAALDEMTFVVEAGQIRQERAQLDFDRKKSLRGQNFLMEKDLTEAEIELRLATNALEGNRARLKIIKERVAKSIIRAPHDGTVLNLKVRDGVVIMGANAGGETSLLMQIADTSQLQVQSDVNEVDIIKVAVGARAHVTFDSVPGAVAEGTVETLALSALPKGTDKAVRVFPLMIALKPIDAPIKPGITANIIIFAAKKDKVVAVPVSAVFAEEGRVFVYAKNGAGQYEERRVQTGISDTAYVEIRVGLKEGEEVALQRPPVVVESEPKA